MPQPPDPQGSHRRPRLRRRGRPAPPVGAAPLASRLTPGRARTVRVIPPEPDVSMGHASWATAEVRSQLASYLARHADAHGSFSGRLVFVQVDHLAEVNRDLGRAAGDQVLLRLEERLRASVDDRLAVAHLGGGLFVAVEPSALPAARDLRSVLERNLRHPTAIDGAVVALVGSVLEVILTSARVASEVEARAVLDGAENRARHGAALEPVEGVTSIEYGLLVPAMEALERAVGTGEIVAHYQPIVELSTGRVVGAEALARWPSAPTGIDGPEDFLLLASAGGLETQLTDQLLDQVCRDAALVQQTAPGTWFTLNLSANEATSPDLADRIDAAMRRHAVGREHLVLEISERIVPDPVTCRALDRLRELDLRLAIDDFGTGWSSFGQMTSLSVDLVKLDRSLVSITSPHATADGSLITAVASMARALGMRVVAEGVETEDDAVHARLAEIDYAQGFLWGKAVPFADLVVALSEQPA
ncbi:GGDEF domain-containing phosphodiesterase [Aquihabitans sp. McL0605]|uniref:GGDEF domain-containing phosphodiesterase n=1 Tax=Aquihabitans sp. McL0605 TaxID=3415671 RepID=UPI003CF2F9DA